jgi:hypothetical protein
MHSSVVGAKTGVKAARGDALIALTTCGRPQLVEKNLRCLMDCLVGLSGFDLVVSIDGLSVPGNIETLSLVQAMGVDCIVSDEPEGVGISKNRVMALLGHYQHYFFLEDDVEVLRAELFTQTIEMYLQTGIHHFSMHEPARLHTEGKPTFLPSGDMIRHAQFGSAQVNFFSHKALSLVGGWHQQFGLLRRGGHTEHSYRVFHGGLCPAPFNYIDKLVDSCCWHNPDSIVSSMGYLVGANRLFEIENELMTHRLPKQPWYANYPGRWCSGSLVESGPSQQDLTITPLLGETNARCHL